MKWWVIDCETTVKNKGVSAVGDMAASPYYVDNKIVLFGERHKGVNHQIFCPNPNPYPNCLTAARKEKVLLIGHNISFDLKYMRKQWPGLYYEVINNIYIWDTQQVAYLLSGQTHMYPSLNQLTEEVGGVLKDEKIKEYWEAGVDTEAIPLNELQNYLDGDLENTEKVFLHQYNIVKEDVKLFNLVKVKMDDILCTTLMEENGMTFDLEEAAYAIDSLETGIALRSMAIRFEVDHFFVPEFDLNPMSNEHISISLYGGKYSVRKAIPIKDVNDKEVLFKTGPRKGKVKTKLQDVEYVIKGFGITPPPGSETTKPGIYSVSDETLGKIDTTSIPESAGKVIDAVLSLRELNKQLETYFRGYSKLVWPDGKIHASFGHCGTRTGRNNHSKPNLGNVTREE